MARLGLPRGRTYAAGLLLAALALTPALVPEVALGQGAPGPMSRAHKDLTSFPVDCNKCHEAGFGVPDEKCLACHTHQPLRARIRADKGFHAAPEVKQKACKDCHAEHVEEPPGSGRGKKTTIDWRPFGGQKNFNHKLTGWPLEGSHRFQACEKCHNKAYPESKLPTFLGLRSECTTCHFGTKKDKGTGGHNPHQFTDAALTECQVCHGFSNFLVPNLGATKFDHDKTRFPLVGLHLRNKCVECHEDIATFAVKDKDFTDCKGCHQDAHRSVISAKRKCASCHDMKVKFQKTTFDHGKETKFPLRGQHAKNQCKDCHKVDGKTAAPETKCAGCHQDVHKGRFGKEACEGCHVDTGWKDVKYDHDGKTKFPLTGKHQASRCVDCHRFGIGPSFERFATTGCADCHKHAQAHCGQFGMENCERCHVRGGDRTSRFDHSLTRFPLERAHGEVDCARCHKPAKLGDTPACKEAVKYTGLEPQCYACHTDVHEDELGKDCARCHTGGENFKTLVFDHNRDARFELSGFHQLVACDQCHPKRRYKMEDITCAACHLKDDVHVARLGSDCAKCHETSGGAPKFDHDEHTRFEREGVHARIECERCHFLTPEGGSAAGPMVLDAPEPSRDAGADGPGPDAGTADGGPPPEVVKVPGPSQAGGIKAAVAPPGAPLDLEFRVAGKACEDCHPDPHQVRAGLDCVSCHGLEQWTSPPRNGPHQSAGFVLDGAHTVVACNLCHSGAGAMSGRGERCGTCHVQDDVHAGSLGHDCGRCHEQLGWIPTTFTHVDVGFVLQGVHRMLDCRQCHQAGNYFIPSNCYNCHLKDYRNADWHKTLDVIQNRGSDKFWITGGAGPGASYDCDRCHNQFTFGAGVFTAPQ